MKSGEYWKQMPEGEKGTAKIAHFEVSRLASQMTALHGGLAYVDEGKYVKLTINGKCVMSDTRMETMTNLDVVSKANGNVLIAGLGIGYILGDICSKDSVKSVLVIEKNQDVIDLVLPHVKFNIAPFGNKLFVLCADIFDWRPERGRKFDTIYNDIWPDLCIDFLEEMTKLHRRQRFWLDRENSQAWMGSWSQDWLRSERRREECWR